MNSENTPRRSAMIDWDAAVSVGGRLGGKGPETTREEAVAAVAELRAGAEKSTPLVREFTGLNAGERSAPVLVIDRPGWIQANADTMRQITTPLIHRLQDKRGAPSATAEAIGGKITGAEVGLMLGFLSSRVLGQFDPFHQKPGEDGRLLLVAPNIVHVERELGVDPHDFRLWVCLHEETHRVQFTAVPWLRDHIRDQIGKVIEMVPLEPTELIGEIARRFEGLAKGESNGGSLLDMMSSPEQREVVDTITGVMSLLEGHADVVMDGVGPEVIPTVSDIRAKFTERRKGAGALDRIFRRLLGLDQKMAQYRDGAIFVRACVDKVGMTGFNAVWEKPENLPSKSEILDPQLWLTRVHGA